MRIISGTARGTKLFTLDDLSTRPTLDRVKESIFNIIQNELQDSVFLDLFSGCGAIGLEAASRGAKEVILCDKEKKAIEIIEKNIAKTHLEEKIKLYHMDFKGCLDKLSNKKIDILYLDPPYKTNMIKEALEKIIDVNLLNNSSVIILETDEGIRVKKEIENINLEIIDERKYGRAEIIFLKYKEPCD
jgi:16S rRNA (guanine966-N2)-methyltransferase